MQYYFKTTNAIFLAESDTSIIKGIENGEFSLDEDDHREQDVSVALLTAARKSVNLPPAEDRTTPTPVLQVASKNAKKTTRSRKEKETPQKAKQPASSPSLGTPVVSTGQAINFLNSDKWKKDVRPPHLADDEVFNTLSVEAAANHIMQWMTTKTMMASNEIKEKRSNTKAGREKPDEKIKAIAIDSGEDDALTTLHKQRFAFRTPLQEPKEYWHLVPIKWQEVNKSVHLEHIGLDNICSPRTLELLHDRSSPIEIKMFMTMNINVGRSGIARKQNLRTLEDGTTEVVCADDWLSPTNINQLLEALDNMVAIWVVMWPGEWSMVTLRRVVTKHLAFGEIQNAELRKRMLEALINEVLSSNASFAARGKPPMVFDKVDKLATRYIDNKKHFEKTFKVDQPLTTNTTDNSTDQKKGTQSKANKLRQEIFDIRKSVGKLKTPSGKEICVFYNSSKGCISTVCRWIHGCCWVKEGGKELCGEAHKKANHRGK